jgi:hypothetical protein
MTDTRRPDKKFKPSNVQYLENFDTYEPEWVRMSEVEGKDQEWYWKNVIPLHTSTVIAGIGGIGKSLVLLSIVTCSMVCPAY